MVKEDFGIMNEVYATIFEGKNKAVSVEEDTWNGDKSVNFKISAFEMEVNMADHKENARDAVSRNRKLMNKKLSGL